MQTANPISNLLAVSQGGPLGLYLLGLVVLIVVGGIWATSMMERRRRDSLRQFAGRLGLKFHEEAAEARRQSFSSLPLFQSGHSQAWMNEMFGISANREVRAFDFRFTRGRGKHKRTHRQSVVAVRLEKTRVPQFELRRSHFGDRLAALVGFDDINFDSHRTFSKQWSLRSNQPTAVRALFRPELLEEIMNMPDVHVQGTGEWIIVFKPDRRTGAAKLIATIEQAIAIRDAFERWGSRARH